MIFLLGMVWDIVFMILGYLQQRGKSTICVLVFDWLFGLRSTFLSEEQFGIDPFCEPKDQNDIENPQ